MRAVLHDVMNQKPFYGAGMVKTVSLHRDRGAVVCLLIANFSSSNFLTPYGQRLLVVAPQPVVGSLMKPRYFSRQFYYSVSRQEIHVKVSSGLFSYFICT